MAPSQIQYNAKSFRMRGHFNKFAIAGRMEHADREWKDGTQVEHEIYALRW